MRFGCGRRRLRLAMKVAAVPLNTPSASDIEWSTAVDGPEGTAEQMSGRRSTFLGSGIGSGEHSSWLPNMLTLADRMKWGRSGGLDTR